MKLDGIKKEKQKKVMGMFPRGEINRVAQQDTRLPFVWARTKDDASSGRAEHYSAPIWQPQARGWAGRRTGRWVVQILDPNGAAVVFSHGAG